MDLAADAGLEVLAITDHDTLAGVEEAVARGRDRGVRVVPGIELSARTSPGHMHLLGYFRSPAPEPLSGRLAGLQERRRARAREMVDRLAGLGAPLDWDDVRARAAGPIGRPHLAEALVAAGHVADRQEAFDRFLGDGRPGYVPSEGLEPDEAIALVAASGGAPVLAHPGSLALGWDHLDPLVGRLARRGLRGIEVHRPEHTVEQRTRYAELARRWGLVACGGSDFHRPGGPVRLGDTGEPPLPRDAIDRLLAT